MSASTISRMQFLRGNFQGGHAPLRPPWSLPEAEFIDLCERCDDCIRACPDQLLSRGHGGFPEISFAETGCDFCGDCLNACNGRALLGDAEDEYAAWKQRAEIDNACLAERGVVCRSCGEACDQRAIHFQLQVGGVAKPSLDRNQCNGCGSCHPVCPVGAIAISHPQQEPTLQA